MRKQKIFNLGVASWCLYDWAQSAFSTLITFVIGTLFTQHMARNPLEGTTQWAHAQVYGALFIALCSPIAGAIADRRGRGKIFLALCTLLLAASCAALAFCKLDPSYIGFTLFLIIIATWSSDIGSIFYNAMLQHIVPRSHTGRISGWGWGIGYIGGISSLIACLFLFKGHMNLQRIGPFLAVWTLIFSIPIFLFTPDKKPTGISLPRAIQKGTGELIALAKQYKRYKNTFLFLLARLIYIDGLNALFAFGGIYAAEVFHMSLHDVLLLGIALNISAGVGAAIMAFADDALGSKPTILISILCLALAIISILLTHNLYWFWGSSLFLALFVGPVQAASRSLLIHLAPKEKITTFFGLFAFSGRATAFLAPWMIALILIHTHQQRYTLFAMLGLILLGGALLLAVKAPKAGSRPTT
jgi:MFS transporter, UMF1 family